MLLYLGVESEVYGDALWANTDILLLLATFAMAMAASFILNQIADIETDRINNKLYFLPRGILSLVEATILAGVFSILAVSYAYSVGVFYGNVILGFILLTGYLYNFKPFRWKNSVFFGAFANLMMGVFAVLYVVNPEKINLPLLGWLTCINFVLFILTTLPDKDGDIQTKKRTIGNNLSKAQLNIVSILFIGISFFLAEHLLTGMISGFFLASYISFALGRFSVEPVIKWNLFVQSLAACLFFLDYTILIIAMYFLGRIYYKKRFNLDYPNFR